MAGFRFPSLGRLLTAYSLRFSGDTLNDLYIAGYLDNTPAFEPSHGKAQHVLVGRLPLRGSAIVSNFLDRAKKCATIQIKDLVRQS